MKKLARKAADSPAMQQAAGAAQAQAAGLAKSAKDKAMERVPRLTEKAKSTVAPLGEHVPGFRARAANGQSQGDTYTNAPRHSGDRQLTTWLATAGWPGGPAQTARPATVSQPGGPFSVRNGPFPRVSDQGKHAPDCPAVDCFDHYWQRYNQPMSPLSGVLGEAWTYYKRFAAHFLLIAFVIYVAAGIIAALLGLAGGIGLFLGWIVSVVAAFLVQAALVKAVQDVRDGQVT